MERPPPSASPVAGTTRCGGPGHATECETGDLDRYGIVNPKDDGASYEIDHRVPLSLGGRDLITNLWPETRDKSVQWNAWVKDRLEFKVYNLVCHPAAGQGPLPLSDAQGAFLRDWTAAYTRYCRTDAACPAYDEGAPH